MTEEINITKGDRTRQIIEDAALALFMEKGYHATSMRQIADRSGLALGGIYNHFSSKEKIFEGIIIDKHPYKKVLPAIMAAEGETVEDFFQNAAQIILNEFGNEPFYIKLMFIEIVEFDGKHGASLLREIAPKIFPVFERVVASRKSLRVTNPAVLMRSFIGMIVSYFATEVIVSQSLLKNLMPSNIASVYTDIYLHGILKPQED